MTARERYPALYQAAWNGGQQAGDALDEIDALTAENETLRHLVTPSPIEEGRYDDALHGELEKLRQWQREACPWLEVVRVVSFREVPEAVDLLRRAGVEVGQ